MRVLVESFSIVRVVYEVFFTFCFFGNLKLRHSLLLGRMGRGREKQGHPPPVAQVGYNGKESPLLKIII